MYLKEIYLQNTGPISECHVKPPFDDTGNPLPIVIVGPNGSGKTIFLSYIVDALTEFAKKAFTDIVHLDGLSKPYFRFIHPSAIRSGQLFSLSLLHFKSNDDNLYYCEKSGNLNSATYSPDVKSVFNLVWNWPTEKNHKDVHGDKKAIETEMQEGAYAFFPTSRHEDPVWQNPRGLKPSLDAPAIHYLAGQLNKPLRVETCADENISWILDVLLDASVDYDIIKKFKEKSDKQSIRSILSETERIIWNNAPILQVARENIEHILREIVQDPKAKLQRRFRENFENRLAIQLGNGQEIPNLQSLSQGQSQLFHLFATIIRYGESVDLNKSIRLRDITGLVVIDEIAAHLHPTLQHDVLPKLINLFPKVQFIISSHSPLFLLGMEKRFGADRVTILELPEAKPINSERYSEFGKAFGYYQVTNHFEVEVEKRFAQGTKPLILTEGPLDSRYIQAALARLEEGELLNAFDIDFVGLEDEKGTHYGGDKGLNHFRNLYEANPSLFHRPILLLYDCDTQKPNEQIGKLWVRSIQQNTENTKVKKGIENLLLEDLFEERFYCESPTDDGGYAKHLDKSKFCHWICENGSHVDFAKFDSVVQILKEFTEAHQLPTDQQLSE